MYCRVIALVTIDTGRGAVFVVGSNDQHRAVAAQCKILRESISFIDIGCLDD